jgi:hypothetical protein
LGEPTAAVYLDASNNSIQDVTIDGFYDGVLVGLNNSAVSNVLTNIVGDTTRHLTTKPVNTVHIAPGTGFTVQELSIMGISGVTGNYTLYDELTMAHLTDPTVAIYALGKSANNGYARFTTSPSVPTWITGTSAPAGSCIQGSMFSCTGGSGCTSTLGNTVLWGCPSGSGWLPIK